MKRIAAVILAILLTLCSAGFAENDTSGWGDDSYTGFYERLFSTGLYIKIPSSWESVYTHTQPYWKDPQNQNELTAWLEPQDFYILIKDYDVYPYTESVDITLQEKRNWHIFTDHKEGFYIMDALTPCKDGGTLILEIKLRDDMTNGWTAARRLVSSVTSFEERNGTGSFSPSMPTPAPTSTPSPAESFHVGQAVFFGEYEQDNNRNNGMEPIEWVILDIQDSNALLLTQYGLDAMAYHTGSDDTTWAQSAIRRWLNSTFLYSAFSASEFAAIKETYVDNSKSQGRRDYNTNGGDDTWDKVFFLSYAEAWYYFPTNTARCCKPTKYATAAGAEMDDSTGYCRWMLRSPGRYQYSECTVCVDGEQHSLKMYYSSGVVRPALWVDLTALSK